MTIHDDRQIWFLTGSQSLYGDDTLRQVADQSAAIVQQLNAGGDIPLTVVFQPVLTESVGIHRHMLDVNADPRCIGVITWMHTFSPAKMWINGLGALQKPMLHLHTQSNVELPYAEIDMDFMNLNQAAHGDREFAHVLTRMGRATQDGRRPRVRSTRVVNDRDVGACGARSCTRSGRSGSPVRRHMRTSR